MPVESLCNFHKRLQKSMRWWLEAISNLQSTYYLSLAAHPSLPRGASGLRAVFHFYKKSSTLWLHLKYPRLIWISSLTPAPLSTDSSVHFTTRDDLRVIPKRKGNERGESSRFGPLGSGWTKPASHPFISPFLRLHPITLALSMRLNYATLCLVIDPEISPA